MNRLKENRAYNPLAGRLVPEIQAAIDGIDLGIDRHPLSWSRNIRPALHAVHLALGAEERFSADALSTMNLFVDGNGAAIPSTYQCLTSAVKAYYSAICLLRTEPQWMAVGKLARRYLDEVIQFATTNGNTTVGERLQDRYRQFEDRQGIPRIVYEARNQHQEISSAEQRSFKRILICLGEQLEKLSQKHIVAPNELESCLRSFAIKIHEVKERLKYGLLDNPELERLLEQSTDILNDARGLGPARLITELKEIILDSSSATLPEMQVSPLKVSIAQYEFEDRNNVACEQIEAINRGLQIDPSLMRPQKGFGYLADAPIVENWLQQHGIKLFTLSLNGKLVGYDTTFYGPFDMPADAQGVARAITQTGLDYDSSCAWVHMLAIEKQARDEARGLGINLYQLKNRAACDGFVAQRFERAMLICRGGPNANTAIERHADKSIGWKHTGKEIIFHGIPYPVMQLELYTELDAGFFERL